MRSREEMLKAIDEWFDGGMAEAERARLAAELDADPELRRRFDETVEAVKTLAGLTGRSAPDGLAERMLSGVRARARREFLVRVAAAAAAVAACVLAAFTVFAPRPAPDRQSAGLYRGGGAVELKRVTLEVEMPEASSVEVVGDFNRWQPGTLRLARGGAARWRLTLNLRPGSYSYKFVVDGKQWICDPAAKAQVDDGFGGRNSLLTVN
jgi:hypothetical protein